MCQCQNRIDNGSAAGAAGQVTDNRAVDLEHVHRKALQDNSATNSRYQNRQWQYTHLQILERPQCGDILLSVVHEHGLGQFQLQARRVERTSCSSVRTRPGRRHDETGALTG